MKPRKSGKRKLSKKKTTRRITRRRKHGTRKFGGTCGNGLKPIVDFFNPDSVGENKPENIDKLFDSKLIPTRPRYDLQKTDEKKFITEICKIYIYNVLLETAIELYDKESTVLDKRLTNIETSKLDINGLKAQRIIQLDLNKTHANNIIKQNKEYFERLRNYNTGFRVLHEGDCMDQYIDQLDNAIKNYTNAIKNYDAKIQYISSHINKTKWLQSSNNYEILRDEIQAKINKYTKNIKIADTLKTNANDKKIML